MNTLYTLDLKPQQYEFLQEMARVHHLPDESKALRCLINFAMQEEQHQKAIFEEVRCTEC